MPNTERRDRTSHRAPMPHDPPRHLFARPCFLIAAIALAAASRLVPHPPNFTPIGAMALFGGATFADRRAAFAAPLAAMLASDLVLGLHILMPVVYACFAFNTLLGRWAHAHRGPLTLAAATLLGSCVFFLATNAACWALWYPGTVEGLLTCYTAAAPFFRNTLIGDAFYTTALFSILALAEWMLPPIRERRPSVTLSPVI